MVISCSTVWVCVYFCAGIRMNFIYFVILICHCHYFFFLALFCFALTNALWRRKWTVTSIANFNFIIIVLLTCQFVVKFFFRLLFLFSLVWYVCPLCIYMAEYCLSMIILFHLLSRWVSLFHVRHYVCAYLFLKNDHLNHKVKKATTNIWRCFLS